MYLLSIMAAIHVSKAKRLKIKSILYAFTQQLYEVRVECQP